MNTYIGTFEATTSRGVAHIVYFLVEAANLAAATAATLQHMRLYASCPMFPPVLISVEEDV